MGDFQSELGNSLITGFLDVNHKSNKDFRPELITNNPSENRKVLTSIISGLQNCDEFFISVAFVTSSGVACIINQLEELRVKNIQGTILISQYLNFSEPDAIKKLRNFENLNVRLATEGSLHTKCYFFKKGKVCNVIVGSSNLTQNALSKNQEWNLKVSASEESEIVSKVNKEFKYEFDNAESITDSLLEEYESVYWSQKAKNREVSKVSTSFDRKIVPNLMQKEALESISNIRKEGKKKALLISATGTGKTFLSAFDVLAFKPSKFLFVVHRRTIAEDAMRTFRTLIGSDVSMGIYSGKDKEIECDFLFATIQTISQEEHLNKFKKSEFDYIVIDETHRAGAASYQKLTEYFDPKFLLGMTATPERTDGFDVFQLFDHNIAYEIRLQRALEEDILSPFHYYGVTDLEIDGELIDEKTEFNHLISDERVDRIIEKAEFYGCDGGIIRGAVFCSSKKECGELSDAFNQRGYRTVSLTGDSSEEVRRASINRLESDDENVKLDYIFTVDIFNEGIDIPKINQIIMLRATQSSIVFVQQLGRGLRKSDSKSYLTVIDFIGNYNNNYLVPIALYGDTSYNKDSLRKLISSGSRLIPGASTIEFDQISKDRIFKAIDSANLQLKKDLTSDYKLLSYKLGRLPLMMDFLNYGSRDPYSYVAYSKSFYNFSISISSEIESLTESQRKLLEVFSSEVNNSKRIEESIILKELFENRKVSRGEIKSIILNRYNYEVTNDSITSAIWNINLGFITENKDKKLRKVKDIYGFEILEESNELIVFSAFFKNQIENDTFKRYLLDSVNYALKTWDNKYSKDKFEKGFLLYQKYSRKDVFRILNWDENPIAQNVGGYLISKDKTLCPIFVNYHKDDDISETTKYEDGFINPKLFSWMSKSKRKLSSPDVMAIRYSEPRMPLFIKKHNGEGGDFYYMGEIKPIDESFQEGFLNSDDDKKVSVVKVTFEMEREVEEEMYEYLTKE